MNKRISTIFILALLASFLFYWFELRPKNIMHDCSWVEVHERAKPADPGITEGEAENNRQACFDSCAQENNNICLCKFLSFESRPPSPAEPAKSWWRKASENQYRFCIREKGLR